MIYTIIGGINGTGKSSLTGVLKAERDDLGCVIDVDKIAAQRSCDNLEAGRIAIRKIEELLERGLDFTQETTLAGRRIEQTARRAKELGYRVRLFYVGLDSVDECISRVAARVLRGGHGVPERDIRRRFAGRFTDLARVLVYCDEARFYDNGCGFVEAAEYKNGEIIPKGTAHPDWIAGAMAALE